MRKIIALITVMSMLALTACAGGNTAAAANNGSQETAGEEADKILFLLMGGKLGDQAANDANWSGIQKYAEESGAECASIEVAELQDFDSTVSSYCEKGFDLIICNGAQPAEFVPAMAEANPDVRFVVMDGTTTAKTDNMLNIRFRVAEGGFVCGAFAALMNQELTGKAETAFIGGVRNPDMDRSLYGYAAGAKYVGGNSTNVYVGNYTDAAKAKELAVQLYSGDVRMIQAWAGGANTGIFEAAKSMGEGYYAMGGATGQFHMSDAILASQVKNNDVAGYDVCKMALEDGWVSGTLDIGLADGAVGIKYAPDGRDADVPQEIKDQIEELCQKVISGEIVPPASEEEYEAFVAGLQ